MSQTIRELLGIVCGIIAYGLAVACSFTAAQWLGVGLLHVGVFAALALALISRPDKPV